jgi:hypothetical protein
MGSSPVTQTPTIPKRQMLVRIIGGIGIVIPVIAFYELLLRLAVNVPFSDDFALMEYILHLKDRSFGENLKLLVAQHAEHRIAYPRLMAVILYYIQGEIDLVAWNVLGCLSITALCVVLYRAVRPSPYKLLYFAPAVWIMHSPFFYSSMYWGMASLQNLTVIFFALLAVLLCVRRTPLYLFLSLLFAAISILTGTVGLIAPLVGLMVLSYQRRYQHLLVYGAATAGLYALYFHDFAQVTSISKTLADYPDTVFAFFFGFLGNSLKVVPVYGTIVILISGFLLFVYFLFLVYEQHFKHNVALFAMILFIIIAAAPSALARGNYGFITSLHSRYSMYSMVLLATLYLMTYEWTRAKYHKFIFAGGLLFSVFFFYNGYLAGQEYGTWFRDSRTIHAARWSKGLGVGELDSSDFWERTHKLLLALTKGGYYKAYAYDPLPLPSVSTVLKEFNGKSVSIKAANNAYFSLDPNTPGGAIIANQGERGNADLLRVEQISPEGLIALQASDSNYVVLDPGSARLYARSATIVEEAKFRLEPQRDGQYALRAANGQYVSMDNNQNLLIVANRTTLGPWEVFTIEAKPATP